MALHNQFQALTGEAPTQVATPFKHVASGDAFQKGPSPFSSDGTPTTGTDVLKAINAQMALNVQRGAQYDIPEEVTVQATKEGYAMDAIISNWHLAKMAAEMLFAKQEPQDLTHSPLAMRMADHLVPTPKQQQEATEASGGTN